MKAKITVKIEERLSAETMSLIHKLNKSCGGNLTIRESRHVDGKRQVSSDITLEEFTLNHWKEFTFKAEKVQLKLLNNL